MTFSLSKVSLTGSRVFVAGLVMVTLVELSTFREWGPAAASTGLTLRKVFMRPLLLRSGAPAGAAGGAAAKPSRSAAAVAGTAIACSSPDRGAREGSKRNGAYECVSRAGSSRSVQICDQESGSTL